MNCLCHGYRVPSPKTIRKHGVLARVDAVGWCEVAGGGERAVAEPNGQNLLAYSVLHGNEDLVRVLLMVCSCQSAQSM